MTRVRGTLATFGLAQWLLTGVFVLALVLVALFAARTIRYSVYWRLHRQEPIERWMTVNYVARSYSVPPDVLWNALGITPPAPGPGPGPGKQRSDRRPLGLIATTQGKSFDEVNATLRNAIANFHPEPPGPGAALARTLTREPGAGGAGAPAGGGGRRRGGARRRGLP